MHGYQFVNAIKDLRVLPAMDLQMGSINHHEKSEHNLTRLIHPLVMGFSDPEGGLSGGLSPRAHRPVIMLMVAFLAIAFYNVLELLFLIIRRFQRRSGLYFYSLLVSCFGVFLHGFAFMAKFFQIWHNDLACVALICLGWYCMVTGQSLVLYSRLGLVAGWGRRRGNLSKTRSERWTGDGKWILWMICANAVIWHGSITVMIFGVCILIVNYDIYLPVYTEEC